MTTQNLILAILQELGSCSKVKLAKIFLFVEREYYRQHEESLTGSYYVRLHMGPVPANYQNILDQEEGNLWRLEMSPIEIPNSVCQRYEHRFFPLKQPDSMTDAEKKVIEKVCHKAKDYSGKKLSDISHQLPAWKHSEEGEPMYIEELVIDNESEYFQLIDAVNRIEDCDDDIPEEVLRLLQR